ncbi:hypothetical protein BDV95DRAFT_320286 [Massariosphaeria phaeospora]|uniref:Uncharacterized protein n=1 Tax=Massariosphaeria phaeospora TaxID=100035 RepID=A0A7C8ID33_9PLEO|nr:hypothetical protein BDV95DRAFT_320286 [Massariosphaeria phaeospora]
MHIRSPVSCSSLKDFRIRLFRYKTFEKTFYVLLAAQLVHICPRSTFYIQLVHLRLRSTYNAYIFAYALSSTYNAYIFVYVPHTSCTCSPTFSVLHTTHTYNPYIFAYVFPAFFFSIYHIEALNFFFRGTGGVLEAT